MIDEEMNIFFARIPQAIPLYKQLVARISTVYSDVKITVQKTQISFCHKHPFAFVWLPIRKMRNRPDVYIIVSFGLSRRIISPRIVEAVEPYPNRWTHHVILQNPEEVDDELMNWIHEAYEFAGRE